MPHSETSPTPALPSVRPAKRPLRERIQWALTGLGLALLVLLVLPSAQIKLGASQLHGLIGSYTTNGHTWQVSYSSQGNTTWTARGSGGGSQTWDPAGNGDTLPNTSGLDAKCIGTVTPTLTWVPTTGQTSATDPPPGQVLVTETGYAYFNGGGVRTDHGTLNDGWPADTPPYSPNNIYGPHYYYSALGTHYEVKDGSSGTITVGPFSLNGSTPAVTDPNVGNDVVAAAVSLTVSAPPFPASVTGDSTVDTAGWDSTHPRFFSGTDCGVKANGVAAKGHIIHMQVDIGGMLVAEYDDTAVAPLTSNQGTAPNKVQYQTGTSQTSYTLTTMFDSTHFANNSQVPVQVEVIDGTGSPYYANIHGPAINNAFLMYNNNGVPYGQNGSVFDNNGVQEAQKAAQDVSAALSPTHITASALDSTDNVNGIEGKLSNPASQYTVFFAADHGDISINGNKYVLGDCLAVPNNSADWLTDSNISTAVNQSAASPTQPPYNFVYLHTCNSGNTSVFANDFGIPVTLGGDRGMMGFTNNPSNNSPGNPYTPAGYTEDGELAVTAQNTLYTQTLWQQLLAGNAAHAAIVNTKRITGGAQEYYEPTQQNQPGALGANNSEVAELIAGSDSNYTLANAVYGGVAGQWFQ